MERDLLMLSQRLMLMLTMDMVLDTELLDMVTDHTDTQLMDIMERDLLMLSQRLMLTTDTVLDTALLDMVIDHMDTQLMDIMERDPLMLSQRLTPTTDTMDMPDLMPMVLMVMVLMDVSGDKLNATQLRSSKANIKYQWRSVPKK